MRIRGGWPPPVRSAACSPASTCGAPPADLRSRLPRPDQGGAAPVEAVREILAEVRKRGDAAVREYTERFDRVGARRPAGAAGRAGGRPRRPSPPALRAALEAAADSVEAYHRHQVLPEGRHERDGVVVRELRRPVDRAGAYVPGGRAGYPSTVLMTAIPARVAGVAEVVLCVPPGPDGAGRPATLAAAALAGVDEVYRIGGAQAMGAMAYGTEIDPPGRRHRRPRQRLRGPGQAGGGGRGGGGRARRPSPARPRWSWSPTTPRPSTWAAIDVIVQAEHGPDGLAWLVTWDEAVADAVTDGRRPGWWRRRPGGPTSRPPWPAAATRCWSTGRSRPGGGQRHRPRAPAS